MIYFAAFIPGLENLIAGLVRERLADSKIIKLLDGAVIFETECTYDRLNFFCFNNIFAVIDIYEAGSNITPELHIKKINNSKTDKLFMHKVISENNKQIKSFRLVCSIENTPAHIDEALKCTIEDFVSRASGLKVNRSKPDTEFWFLSRREGFSCFMKRLTNHRQGEKVLHKGELSPQLAWLLCRFIKLKHGELVADPFCGYGSIPLAAIKHFPIKFFFASDIDSQCVKFSNSKTGLKGNERIEIKKTDFCLVRDFITRKLDAIVTDPPWGMYKENVSLQKFYDEMLDEFTELLNENGRAVILTAAIKELESAIERNNAFTIKAKINILVSGKKASIYELTKNHN